MAQEAWLDVFKANRPREEWIVEQVDLPHRQVVGSAPVGVDAAQLVRVEGLSMREVRRDRGLALAGRRS
jgi:hypothetical protein